MDVFTTVPESLPASGATPTLGELEDFRLLDAATLDEVDPQLPELRHLIGVFDVRADRLDVLRLDRRQQRVQTLLHRRVAEALRELRMELHVARRNGVEQPLG